MPIEASATANTPKEPKDEAINGAKEMLKKSYH